MRPLGFVVAHPTVDQPAGGASVAKDVLIQAFVPEPTIEGLAEGILGGLAWGNVVQVEITVLSPADNGIRGELGAVVRGKELGLITRSVLSTQIARSMARVSASQVSVCHDSARTDRPLFCIAVLRFD